MNVHYIAKPPTTITVTSEYLKETYTYDITAGKIDGKETYAELVQKDTSTARDSQTVVIYTKDADGNTIDFLAVEEKEKFVYLNTNYNMSRIAATKVSAQSLPKFVLDLYDKEWNNIKILIITTELIKAEVDLPVTDVGESKNSSVFSSNTVNANKCY